MSELDTQNYHEQFIVNKRVTCEGIQLHKKLKYKVVSVTKKGLIFLGCPYF